MELLQLFQDCLIKTTTVKQAFEHLGLNKIMGKYEILKALDEEAEFACLINWIIHRMPTEQKLKIRFKVTNEVYQVSIRRHNRNLHVESLKSLTKEGKDFMLYDWREETTYNTLTSTKINEAIEGADLENAKRELERRQKGCFTDSITVTDEEMELINEFLYV